MTNINRQSEGRQSMKVWVTGGGLAALVVGALACGDSEPGRASPDAVPDSGVNPAAEADASSVTEASSPNLLKAGKYGPIGVTPGGMLVYWTPDRTIEAIPLTGGEPVKIAPSIQILNGYVPMAFSNGALAWWTNLSADFVGTLNVWNETDGVKIVSTTSTFRLPNPTKSIFAASSDGRRIAFSTRATATTTNLRVADVATAGVAAEGILPEADVFRVDDAICAERFDMRFVGKKLFVGFCASDSARLYAAPDTSATAVRLDDQSLAKTGITWSADELGNKVFYADTSGGRFVDLTDLAAITREKIDGANSGFITKDGNAVIYRANDKVNRWPTPKPGPQDVEMVLATNALSFNVPTDDRSRVWIFDGAHHRTIDTSRYKPARLISKDPSATPVGYTASGKHAVYTTTVAADLTLHARPALGGTETLLTSGLDVVTLRYRVFLAPQGDGLTMAVNPDPPIPSGDLLAFANATFELQYRDLAKGTSVSLGDGLAALTVFAGKKVIYARVKEPGAGMYLYDPK